MHYIMIQHAILHSRYFARVGLRHGGIRCCRFHSVGVCLLLLGPGFRFLAHSGVMCRAFSAPSLGPCVSRGAWHFTLLHALLGALGAFRVKMLNLTPFSADQAECELRLCRGRGWKAGRIDEC
jgi:hypothetical protein